jgi:hypothetical protein
MSSKSAVNIKNEDYSDRWIACKINDETLNFSEHIHKTIH